MLDEQVLDLLREDVLTAGDDHVVVAPVDEQQPVLVEVAHVAAGHVAVDDLLVAAVGVSLETRRTADEDPAPLVGAVDAPVVLVEQHHFGGHRRAAGRSGSASQFVRGGDGGEAALGGRVDVVEDVAESVLYAVGQLGGQRRPGDRDRLQRRRVVGGDDVGSEFDHAVQHCRDGDQHVGLVVCDQLQGALRLESTAGDHLVAQRRTDEVGRQAGAVEDRRDDDHGALAGKRDPVDQFRCR